MAQRTQALDAARDEMGDTIKNADPCTQCGAKLFGKEAKGMCCKNGKSVLPRLPPPPQDIEECTTLRRGGRTTFGKSRELTTAAATSPASNVFRPPLRRVVHFLHVLRERWQPRKNTLAVFASHPLRLFPEQLSTTLGARISVLYGDTHFVTRSIKGLLSLRHYFLEM